MSTSSLVIPEDLPQEVVKWSNANVQNSLEANKAEYYIEDDDIKILEQKNVTGRILLGLTSKRLENYGLVKGAADLIVMIVEQLKVIKELGESDIVAPLALESLTFSNLCLFVPTTEASGTTGKYLIAVCQ
ncbi:hypothetical protein FRC03_005468 [Tulasnella sp. 419]|nr:hypothetical protein FRC03_005468 [Tulasnella sp. 419]